MVNRTCVSPDLGDSVRAASILDVWRANGPDQARHIAQQFDQERPPGHRLGLLERELVLRLSGAAGPRLLLDGIWFSRPYGGITRVWEQILQAWQLPGMVSHEAPVALIERNSHLALCDRFPALDGAPVDPLDHQGIAALAAENAVLAQAWGADVFLSSWISACGEIAPACLELALVHDCLPERFGVPPSLQPLRRRWLTGARAHLAVSADTAQDLACYLGQEPDSISWCHSAPAPFFSATLADPSSHRLWPALQSRAGLSSPYVLLPATSAIGSYKNPELVGEALVNDHLAELQLVLCGVGAKQRCEELESRYPRLQGRCLAVGLTDLELALVYHHALAVVLPSHAEGFGLPAIEAMSAGATVLLADSRGLREAGGEAALRFHPRRPFELVQLLSLLLHPDAGWLKRHLQCRAERRLALLHPDLLGLALLALARRLGMR
jgi:glycosyltransferase involved in cell wall biosynthesis